MKTKDKAIVGLGLAIDSLLDKTRGGSADVEAARRIVQAAWEVFRETGRGRGDGMAAYRTLRDVLEWWKTKYEDYLDPERGGVISGAFCQLAKMFLPALDLAKQQAGELPLADDKHRAWFAVTEDGFVRFYSQDGAKAEADRSLAAYKKAGVEYGEMEDGTMDVCWGRIIEQVVEVPYPGDGDYSDYVLRRLP